MYIHVQAGIACDSWLSGIDVIGQTRNRCPLLLLEQKLIILVTCAYNLGTPGDCTPIRQWPCNVANQIIILVFSSYVNRVNTEIAHQVQYIVINCL